MTNSTKRSTIPFLICAVFVPMFSATFSSAQAPQGSPKHNPLAHLPQLERRMDTTFVNRLSAGGANMFHLAKVLSQSNVLDHAKTLGPAAKTQALNRPGRFAANASRPGAESSRIGTPGFPVAVNDADLDYQFSRFAGFTQSETSSAWCGNNIVTGFNDSGALLRSVLDQVGGQSFTGVATSPDRGRSFVGLPFLNPGNDPGTFLGGDPVVVCSDPQNLFYSSLYQHVTLDAQGNVLSAVAGVSLSHSTSGGLVWGDPIPASTKDANFHFLDKEWLAIDPQNPQNLYVTYTDFGAHNSDSTCNDNVQPGGENNGPDVHIELVASKDGGNSWSAPVLLDRKCSILLGQNLSGSQVVVGSDGQVFVAWAFVDQKNVEIRFSSSKDGGITFGAFVVAGQATAASSLGFDHLEGNFRTNPFPTLAVDNSKTAGRGTLYLGWTDASLNQVTDDLANFFFFDSVYSFGDIVLSKSTDGGNSWSTSAVVSPTPANFAGAGRDQFMAGASVDAHGNLAVCYSDRRNDVHNLMIDHFCSVSRDHGQTFHDIRETAASWAPGHTTDVFINPAYMGDYDVVSSDVTGANRGFFSTFQIQNNTNPDVFGVRIEF